MSGFDSVEKSLRAYLSEAGRVTVVGVGNTLRQDDCVGVAVVRELRKTGLSDIQLLEDEAVPEDRIPEIEAFKPTHVVIIDAALLGMPPGSTVFKTSFETVQQPISTHALPLRLFAEYLKQNVPCRVALLLVEPSDVDFGEGMTPEIQKSSSKLTASLFSILKERKRTH